MRNEDGSSLVSHSSQLSLSSCIQYGDEIYSIIFSFLREAYPAPVATVHLNISHRRGIRCHEYTIWLMRWLGIWRPKLERAICAWPKNELHRYQRAFVELWRCVALGQREPLPINTYVYYTDPYPYPFSIKYVFASIASVRYIYQSHTDIHARTHQRPRLHSR